MLALGFADCKSGFFLWLGQGTSDERVDGQTRLSLGAISECQACVVPRMISWGDVAVRGRARTCSKALKEREENVARGLAKRDDACTPLCSEHGPSLAPSSDLRL